MQKLLARLYDTQNNTQKENAGSDLGSVCIRLHTVAKITWKMDAKI